MSLVVNPPEDPEVPFDLSELKVMLANLDKYSDVEVIEINAMVDELERRRHVASVRNDLIEFCKHIQPDYKVGRHHKILARTLMNLEAGIEDRACVNMPPRHGKTQITSIYAPAWYLGRNPGKKVMLISHTADLAVDFGRKVRNLINSDAYREIFPNVQLAADSKSAGRWNTNHGGEFYATGVGSALAGRGAHFLIVDDPHNEQDILNGNLEIFQKAYEWFVYGARTRLMPDASVAIVHTRWHLSDMTGQLVSDMVKNPQADQYNVIEFPAILDVEDAQGKIIEKPLWPEFFDLEALHRTKASMPLFQWNAQYQQNPTAEEAAVVKRDWWQLWEKEDPPDCEYLIMSLDAAAEKHNRADYTVLTTWGVFFNEHADAYHIILLNSIRDRYEFPELKRMCMEEYKEWEPDAFIVEKKSAGVAIYQEMRRMGIPVSEYTPHRGTGDKMARLNSVSDIVSSGLCWVPRTRWAEELVDEIAAFPFSSHDDLVDSTVMALMRFRQGGFIRLPSDLPDEIEYFKRNTKKGYHL